jgi:hypothetical protein
MIWNTYPIHLLSSRYLYSLFGLIRAYSLSSLSELVVKGSFKVTILFSFEVSIVPVYIYYFIRITVMKWGFGVLGFWGFGVLGYRTRASGDVCRRAAQCQPTGGCDG